MQLRAALGKSKSTAQKLVMTVNFYQAVNMSSKTMLVYQNNISIIVLQISRLSEGSTGQIFATSSVIYQMKM